MEIRRITALAYYYKKVKTLCIEIKRVYLKFGGCLASKMGFPPFFCGCGGIHEIEMVEFILKITLGT